MSATGFELINKMIMQGVIVPKFGTRQIVWQEFLNIVNAGVIEQSKPKFTPAQEHADELLAWARKLTTEDATAADIESMKALIVKIDPPKPVTLAEALEVLREVEACDKEKKFVMLEGARKLLKRYEASK